MITSSLEVRQLLQLINGQLLFPEHTPIDGILKLDGVCTTDLFRKDAIAFTEAVHLDELLGAADGALLSALVVGPHSKSISALPAHVTVIQVASPLQACLQYITRVTTNRADDAISPLADISPSAEISANVQIGPFCVIGPRVRIGEGTRLMARVVLYEGVELGTNCTLHSGVTIREFCKIGDRTIIQNGSIIGADGFGYFIEPNKGLQPVPQIGIVECEADVFIGANTCIDRATFGKTIIKRGTRIENLVQVGHNNVIGEDCEIGSQVGLAGSSDIGAQSKLSTNVKVRDHLKIAPKTDLAMSTQVFHNIKEGGSYAGEGPYPSTEWEAIQKALNRLPELTKLLKNTEEKTAEEKN